MSISFTRHVTDIIILLNLDMGNISKQSKLIPIEATMKHQFIQRSTFPSSPVVYTDGCCLGNGTHQAVGGVGVYWGPQHPR